MANAAALDALVSVSRPWMSRGLATPGPAPASWTSTALGGCLAELSGTGASPSLTLSFGLVHQLQQQGEPTAWVTRADSTFFPPDAAQGGVDLAALPVVRLASQRQCLRAADQLARSGAFGLLVIDLGRCLDLPLAVQTRLAGQALAHGTLILCLTVKTESPTVVGIARLGPRSRAAHPSRRRSLRVSGACAQGQAARSRMERRGVVPWDRMACVELPAFPLQILLKRHLDWADRPVAVVDRDKPQGVILWVNEQARAARIRTGMRYSAGLSLAHTLHAGEVSPADVERGVAAIATRLHRFSPEVEPCRGEPGVFWLNASGLFHSPSVASPVGAGGSPPRSRRAAFGPQSRSASRGSAPMPSPRPLTSGESVVVIRDLAGERVLAGRVRLSRLGIDPALRDNLHKLGVHTVRAFLQLPAGGSPSPFRSGRRNACIGSPLGDLWAPLRPLCHPEPLVARHDLDDPEIDAVRLLFHIKRLLDRLLAIVAARHEALAELTLHLQLDRAGAHTERIRPAAPTLDVVQLMNLVRLRLESLALGAGVIELHVTGRAVATTAVQQGLFVERPRRDRTAAERALARVRAEFGDEAVVRALLSEAHLPEARFAWELVETVPFPEPREVACRPMVRRIHAYPVALPPVSRPEPGGRLVRGGETGYVRDLAGPYLVSGGWWRSAVHREYYFVRMQDGDMLWIYYDRPRRRWRCQGQVE